MQIVMKTFRTASLLLLAAAVLTACFGTVREPVYQSSTEINPLEIPADLDRPRTRDIYDVPGYFLPELAGTGTEALPPEVQPSAVAEQSRAHIRFGRTGLYLAVQDEPDSVWRRLGFTLNRGDMQVNAVDETARLYRFRLDHEPILPEVGGFSRLLFWRKAGPIDYSGSYQARVSSEMERGATSVELLDADGSVVEFERAEYVLARLRERLG